MKLLRLIDGLMPLTDELTPPSRESLQQRQDPNDMAYVTSFERIRDQEECQEGRQEGAHENTWESNLEVLETQFGEVPFYLRERIKAFEDEQALRQWLCRAALLVEMDQFWKDANTRVTDV